MWVFSALIVLVVVAVVLWFGFLNATERVTLTLIPSGRVVDVPAVLALLVAFLFGMFTWYLVSVFQFLRTRGEVRRARKEADRFRDELKAFRNLPVRDLDEPGDVLDADEPTS